MRFSRISYPIRAALAAALVLVGGCVEPMGDASSASPGTLEMSEYTSEHYHVQLVGSKASAESDELARHTALMMEQMYNVYAGMEELPLPPGEVMPFWLHFNREEYDRQAAKFEFPAKSTNGFCSTSGEVHVFFRKYGELPPEATAMHEGFHQYCYRALHYPTPPEVFQAVPGYKLAKIPTVPLWLAEGMATNMESGRITRDRNGIAIAIDDVGAVNTERLSRLARMINNKRCPPIRSVMNLIMGDQISTDDYAVMWGLVFDLRMATGDAIYAREQKALERAGPEAVNSAIQSAIDPSRSYPYLRWPVPVSGRLLRACRVVWGLDVPRLVEVCATGATEPRDFERQWNRRVTQAALAEVEKLLKDNGETLEQWEEGWRRRMLALYMEVKGGSYRYVEPANIQKAHQTFLDAGADAGTSVRRSKAIGAW